MAEALEGFAWSFLDDDRRGSVSVWSGYWVFPFVGQRAFSVGVCLFLFGFLFGDYFVVFPVSIGLSAFAHIPCDGDCEKQTCDDEQVPDEFPVRSNPDCGRWVVSRGGRAWGEVLRALERGCFQ